MCFQEHMYVMQRKEKTAVENALWTIAVPRQQELAGNIPYEHAMTAEELLQELVCQRLECVSWNRTRGARQLGSNQRRAAAGIEPGMRAPKPE